MSSQSLSVTLNLTETQHAQLYKLLFLPDGKEAAAIALCGRRAGAHRHRLLVQEIYEIDLELYSHRSVDGMSWSTDCLAPLLEKAEEYGLSVVKIHSHPGGYPDFSEIDEHSDRQLMPLIRGWVEADVPHATAVMLPSGQMFGRFLWKGNEFSPLD